MNATEGINVFSVQHGQMREIEENEEEVEENSK